MTMMRLVTWIGAVALVAVLAVTVASPGRAQAPTVLTAAVGNNMNHVPSFVGVEKGIFLKHGVDLKLKVLSTGQEMSKALQAGEAQIIGSAYSNYALAVERGMAAKGVVGLMGDRSEKYSDQPVSVWTRKGSGIARVEDLAGRKVGTPVGGTADEYLGVLLKKKGVPRDRVQVLNVPPGNLVSALQGGSVDAVACWEPFGSLVEARVPDAVLLSRGGGHVGYYINMAIRNELIEKSPEVVERYVIGVAEATAYTRRNPDEAAEISTRWVPGLDVAVARKALASMVYDARITAQTVAAWDENVKILVEQKKLRTAVPWQQGIELRFIEKVMRSHPQFFTDLKPAP
jgi:ABC-type nitrate/sulfonate/bicarbonate transport system substrate-binding protein